MKRRIGRRKAAALRAIDPAAARLHLYNSTRGNGEMTEQQHRAAAFKRLTALTTDGGMDACLIEAQIRACDAILRNTSYSVG